MIWQTLERASISELTLFLTTIIMCIFFYTFSDYIRNALLAFKLPGPKAVPFIGNCLLIKEQQILTNRVARGYKDYGPLARIWLSIFPFIVVFEPEHLQIILGSQKHTEKSFFYKLLHNFLGDGLITSSGKKWHNHRKLIQPSFHLNILEKFIGTFAASAQCLHKKLKENEAVNITSLINECVLDILNESILGVPINGSKLENSPFRQGKVVLDDRIAKPWLLFNWIYRLTSTFDEELNQKKRLDEFTKKMILKRREALKGEVAERKSLLDYMLDISENHPEFTEQDIVNETATFMLAGQDSVGASIAISIFLLAQHLNNQEKCIQEIDSIFGKDSRSPTLNDLKEMKYLEMCIKEALRLYPAVPIIARRLGEDVACGKTVLPAGCEIFIIPYATHRLEHIYCEPENYIPERFLPENCEERNPYAFLPFSAGPRNCIGYKFAILEMKTVISTILRSYRILPVAGKTSFEPLFRITLRARGGLWVQFEPRNNNNNNEKTKNFNLSDE